LLPASRPNQQCRARDARSFYTFATIDGRSPSSSRAVFGPAILRTFLARSLSLTVSYPDASRSSSRPAQPAVGHPHRRQFPIRCLRWAHRCSTCLVLVIEGVDAFPHDGGRAKRVLTRSTRRLACACMPCAPDRTVTIHPLLPPQAHGPRGLVRRRCHQGKDISGGCFRRSARLYHLAERLLPL